MSNCQILRLILWEWVTNEFGLGSKCLEDKSFKLNKTEKDSALNPWTSSKKSDVTRVWLKSQLPNLVPVMHISLLVFDKKKSAIGFVSFVISCMLSFAYAEHILFQAFNETTSLPVFFVISHV